MPPPRLFGVNQVFSAFSKQRSSLLQCNSASKQLWRTSQPSALPRTRFHTLHTSTSRFSQTQTRLLSKHPFNLSSSRYPSRTLRRFNSTNQQPSKPLGFSERMRKLSREYGWSALGVYLFLSALDFPFCFAAVRLLGVERIGHYEQVVVDSAKSILSPIWGPSNKNGPQTSDTGDVPVASRAENIALEHGILETDGATTGEGASIWTQLALAYAVHKSLIFLRVPLTAAVTPKVVKTLRRWGWNIGKRKSKSG